MKELEQYLTIALNNIKRAKKLAAKPKFKVKSVMTVPIIGISYKLKNKTTICKINWVNPLTGNIQVSRGIATCNPEDAFDTQIGERLAESRAKLRVYSDYSKSILDYHIKIDSKLRTLVYNEIEHQNKINPSKKNKNNKENE